MELLQGLPGLGTLDSLGEQRIQQDCAAGVLLPDLTTGLSSIIFFFLQSRTVLTEAKMRE